MKWAQRFLHVAPSAPVPQDGWPPLPEGPEFGDVAGVFEFGYCHVLALALHERAGWPIVHMTRDRGSGSHYLVRRDDGLLVDVRGARTAEQVADQWDQDGPRSVLTDTTPDEVIGVVVQGDLPDPAPVWDLARHVADSLVGDWPPVTGGWVYEQPRITGGWDYEVTFPGNPDCDQKIMWVDNLLSFLSQWHRDVGLRPGMAQVTDLRHDLVWDAAAFLDHHTGATEPVALGDVSADDVATAVSAASDTFGFDVTAARTVVDLLVQHGDVADGAGRAWVLDQIRDRLREAGNHYTEPDVVSHLVTLILQGNGR